MLAPFTFYCQVFDFTQCFMRSRQSKTFYDHKSRD